MNDIFLSYASEDSQRAHRLATALEDRGWSVWSDREIPPGKTFDEVIEAELNAARCVVVLWSKHSISSRWVKAEAAAAADRNCLIPVAIDDVPLPLEFNRIQTARLLDWDDPTKDPEFDKLVQALGPIPARQQPVQAKPIPSTTPKRPSRSLLSIIEVAAIAIAAVVLGFMYLSNKGSPAGPDISAGTPGASQSSSSAAPGEAIPIKIGDRISDGEPAAGAGSLDKPFEEDTYLFSASPRQNVYFRMLEHGPGMSYIYWRVNDENGMEVFNSCLGCGEPGVHMLTRGGNYTLRVGSSTDPATGIYKLQLFNVPPPQRFSITPGVRIQDGTPGAGAGVIESPGTEDIYAFTASPRQKLHFRMLEHGPGMSYINWNLTDSNGMNLFEQCLGCGDPGVHTLVGGGSYTITVGNRSNPATGTYALQITPQ